MLNQTLTLADSNDINHVFERSSSGERSTVHTNLGAELGYGETIKVDHRIVGKGDARVRQTRVRLDLDRLNATTGKSGNVNGSFLFNVPQSGLVIQDADVKTLLAFMAQLIGVTAAEIPSGALVTASQTSTLAPVLTEGSL